MLGILRFVLAVLVFLSHFPAPHLAVNLGITAVVIFYFTSGYLMQKSATRFSANHPKPTQAFYLDRCIKIFPQYLFVVFLTFLMFKIYGPSQDGIFATTEFSISRLLFDATLLPVNLVEGALLGVIGSDGWGTSIVPPAFSLAIELQFYLLVPLLIFLRSFWVRGLAILSAILLTVSAFNFSGPLSMIEFGYQYLPGMLVLFLFGFTFADNEKSGFSFVLWAYFAILFTLLLPSFYGFQKNHTQAVLIGAIVCLPIFSYCYHFVTTSNLIKQADRYLGDLSYPLFLSHSLGLYLAEHWFGVSSTGRAQLFLAAFSVTLVISSILAAAQRTIDSKRVAIRGFASLRSSAS